MLRSLAGSVLFVSLLKNLRTEGKYLAAAIIQCRQDRALAVMIVVRTHSKNRGELQPTWEWSERTFLNLEQPRLQVSVKTTPSYCQYGDQDEKFYSKSWLSLIEFVSIHCLDTLDGKCPGGPEPAHHHRHLPHPDGPTQGLLQTAQVFLHLTSDRENHWGREIIHISWLALLLE